MVATPPSSLPILPFLTTPLRQVCENDVSERYAGMWRTFDRRRMLRSTSVVAEILLRTVAQYGLCHCCHEQRRVATRPTLRGLRRIR